MSSFITGLFLALAVTIVVELVIGYIVGLKSKDSLKVIVLMNIITNLSLNIILSLIYTIFKLEGASFIFVIIILEMIVVFVEFYILYYVFGNKIKWLKLLYYSVILNTTSFVVGELIFHNVL